MNPKQGAVTELVTSVLLEYRNKGAGEYQLNLEHMGNSRAPHSS